MPLCKAWGVWTNSSSLALALDGPHVRCAGGHPSVPVGGADTEHSGSYPENFAIFVHTALAASEQDVAARVEAHCWPCNLGSPIISGRVNDGRDVLQPGLALAGTGTAGGRRCLKPAVLSQSGGGADQQGGPMESDSAVSVCGYSCQVVGNARAVSSRGGLLNPTGVGMCGIPPSRPSGRGVVTVTAKDGTKAGEQLL